jgi:hypothetical protein
MTHPIYEGPLLDCFEGIAPTHQFVETRPAFQPNSPPIARPDARQRRRRAASNRRPGSASDTKLCAAAHKLEIYYRRQADLCERIAAHTAQDAIADELMLIVAEFRAASAAFSELRKSMVRDAQGSRCDDGRCDCLRRTKGRKPE